MASALNYTNRVVKVVESIWTMWNVKLNSKEFHGDIESNAFYKAVEYPNHLVGLRGMVLVKQASSPYDGNVRVSFKSKEGSSLGLFLDSDFTSVGFIGVENPFADCVMDNSHFETGNNAKMGLELDAGYTIDESEQGEAVIGIEWLTDVECRGLFKELEKDVYEDSETYS